MMLAIYTAGLKRRLKIAKDYSLPSEVVWQCNYLSRTTSI